MNKRMNRNKLNIGVYRLHEYAHTEKHVREIKECGIDFVIADYPHQSKQTLLNLFAKYGLGLITSDGIGWWGGDSSNAGRYLIENSLDKLYYYANKFKDHPCIWGINIGDEPSALDFSNFAVMVDKVNKCYPNQFAYMNLYPNYASVSENKGQEVKSQLGTTSYKEYIKKYCESIPNDYICFDYYYNTPNLKIEKFYENLKIVSDACRNTGRSMWVVLQVNSRYPDSFTTINQLRFQAFISMAFGAENIIWACYTAGWFYNQVLDENGEKTEQYEKLKKVNHEISAMADVYVKYRRVDTHFVGEDKAFEAFEAVKALNTGVFFDLHADGNSPLVVAQMSPKNNDGSNALFVLPTDDPYDKNTKDITVSFKTYDKNITALCGDGVLPICKMRKGKYSVQVKSNQGFILIARD